MKRLTLIVSIIVSIAIILPIAVYAAPSNTGTPADAALLQAVIAELDIRIAALQGKTRILPGMPIDFVFTSGVGAWGTVVTVCPACSRQRA